MERCCVLRGRWTIDGVSTDGARNKETHSANDKASKGRDGHEADMF